jgi:glycosyltransferase involved in cell wall biosynthesis
MKIAAVIPVRNRPVVLLQALRSVQAQSHPVSEIVIVDDASTDETADVALSMVADDKRIHVVQQPERRGAAAARNIGWRAAQADWIAFLDSDDEWMPEKLERQVECLNSHDNAIACFTGYKVKEDDWCYAPPKNVTLFNLLRANILGPTSIALVSRSALEAVGGFDEQLPSCQDWDLWIKLLTYGEIQIVSDPLVRFEETGKDRITKNYESVVKGHQIVFARIMKRVHGLVPRLRTRAYHDARMSQIMLDDFGKPLRAAIFSVRSGIRWPNGHALHLLRRSLRQLTRGQ